MKNKKTNKKHSHIYILSRWISIFRGFRVLGDFCISETFSAGENQHFKEIRKHKLKTTSVKKYSQNVSNTCPKHVHRMIFALTANPTP